MKDIIKRLDAIKNDIENRREAWRAPDALSAGLREVHRGELVELASELDLLQYPTKL